MDNNKGKVNIIKIALTITLIAPLLIAIIYFNSDANQSRIEEHKLKNSNKAIASYFNDTCKFRSADDTEYVVSSNELTNTEYKEYTVIETYLNDTISNSLHKKYCTLILEDDTGARYSYYVHESSTSTDKVHDYFTMISSCIEGDKLISITDDICNYTYFLRIKD